jgi:putative ABC transport system ATP-binding protein
MISMRGIRKVYSMGAQEVQALRGVDLDIGANEYVAVVGPSGSGKSTLMNILGCLDTPTSGEYLLSGEAVGNLDRNRLAEIRNKRIGFVFQNFNLLPYASARENVELPLLFGGVGTRERKERAEAMLRRVGLEDRMDHKPTELSGGQMQRVAIARSLVNRPRLLFADEPTGNLDSRTSKEVLEMFQRLNEEEGITIILAVVGSGNLVSASGQAIVSLFRELHAAGQTIVLITHDSTVAKLAARIVRIQDGLVVEDRSAAA